MITDIYRIKTANSVYEIQVRTGRHRYLPVPQGRPRGCGLEAGLDRGPSYLEKLFIGPSFDVPGVVLTSMVEDYVHLVPSGEPKRRLTARATPGGLRGLTDAIIGQVKGQVAVVGEPIIGIEDDGPMESYL